MKMRNAPILMNGRILPFLVWVRSMTTPIIGSLTMSQNLATNINAVVKPSGTNNMSDKNTDR